MKIWGRLLCFLGLHKFEATEHLSSTLYTITLYRKARKVILQCSRECCCCTREGDYYLGRVSRTQCNAIQPLKQCYVKRSKFRLPKCIK